MNPSVSQGGVNSKFSPDRWDSNCNVLFNALIVLRRDKRHRGKGKGHPRTGHEAPEGEQIYSFTFPSTSALDGGWVVNATPRPFYPGERPGTRCIRSWVGPQGRSGRVWKISPQTGYDPWTVHPVASRYTDWAIRAHRINTNIISKWSHKETFWHKGTTEPKERVHDENTLKQQQSVAVPKFGF